MPAWFNNVLLAFTLLLGAPAQGGEVVRVGGSGVGLGGLQLLARAYQVQHPESRILLLPSIGSAGGIRAVQDGKLDLACSARPLLESEKVPGLEWSNWATTPFCFVTHPSTAAEDLSLKVIEDMYGTRRRTWQDGHPVRLVLRPKSDSSFAYLSGLTPGMRAALDRAHLLPGVCIGITDQEALTNLERTPGSFGTAALGPILSEGRKVQILSVDGLRPTESRYPFQLTILLVHRHGIDSSNTRDFLEFIRSKPAQRLLLQAGYQPLLPARPESGR
jgi:phosphate transport system substrate-binding protein